MVGGRYRRADEAHRQPPAAVRPDVAGCGACLRRVGRHGVGASDGPGGQLAVRRDPGGFHPLLCVRLRSEEHTSELQSLMRISYAVFCLKKKKKSPLKLHISIYNTT